MPSRAFSLPDRVISGRGEAPPMKRYFSRTSSSSSSEHGRPPRTRSEKGRDVFKRTGAAVSEQQDSAQSSYLDSQLRGIRHALVCPSTLL